MTDPTPLDIVIVSPGLPHDGGTLAQRSLGGSETAAIMVARALARRGHHVTVFSPGHQGSLWDDVRYLPIETAATYLASTPHDMTVISRAPEGCSGTIASPVHVLWCHDLGLKRQRGIMGGVSWNIDWIYGVSRWHVEQLAGIHSHLPREFFRATRNGIDLTVFKALRARQLPRDPWRLVYGSRPERGLEAALNVMELLARRGRPWHLYVSHYENTTEQLAPMYHALFQRARALPNVTVLGALTQEAWRESLVRARALLYPHAPGDFREVSCIAAMEAQGAGTPIVACAKGALSETISPDAGLFVGGEETDPHSTAHTVEFADAIERLADDPTWRALSQGARQRATALDWDGVAAQWAADATACIVARSGDWKRAVRHFARIGDREALAVLPPVA